MTIELTDIIESMNQRSFLLGRPLTGDECDNLFAAMNIIAGSRMDWVQVNRGAGGKTLWVCSKLDHFFSEVVEFVESLP